jgi:hypothetical protein
MFFIRKERTLPMLRIAALILLASATTSHAQIVRKELKRADVAGTNMEAIGPILKSRRVKVSRVTRITARKSCMSFRGATLILPDGSQSELPTGAGVINQRGVPHAGFKIGRDKILKLINVFVVDKGKPLTEVVQ